MRSGTKIHCVESDKKNSYCFGNPLHKLTVVYAQAKEIHVISTTMAFIAARLPRWPWRILLGSGLHFLPPYSPDENAIGCPGRTCMPMSHGITPAPPCSS